MGLRKILYGFVTFVFFAGFASKSTAYSNINTDTLHFAQTKPLENPTNDTLLIQPSKSKLTEFFYNIFIKPPRPYVDEKALTLEYYSQMSGKTISEIKIIPLDVFGPTFEDTCRKAKSWFEKNANILHSKSNLKSINRMLIFKVGDTLNPNTIYENERIIRLLPYIKDLRFKIIQDSINTELVKIYLLTKDRFSFGVSGGVEESEYATLEVYNKNIFGVGHEITARFVGNIQHQPYTGIETYYKINNIKGKFIDISAGYVSTYRRAGLTFILNKPFITPNVKWGFGASAIRWYKTDRIFEDDPIRTKNPLNLTFYNAWLGKSIELKQFNSQLVVSAGFLNRTFHDRPVSYDTLGQFYSNSTFYLAGITFSQRRYVQDKLIYSYGITEDIPEGFKNEIVYGFDANEFGNRHYAHIFLSNGNLLVNRKGYLYLSAGFGGFIHDGRYEQGIVQGSVNFISKQYNAGKKRLRLFVRSNYILGLNRFEIENLELRKNEYIRGFKSRETIGKQLLNLNMEYVLFLRKEIFKFSLAPFSFTDIGIIGTNKQLIFYQNYYSGLGIGIRVHNENFAFKTVHLRISFYPFHPKDMGLMRFLLSEQLKKSFYSFEPKSPQPLRFE